MNDPLLFNPYNNNYYYFDNNNNELKNNNNMNNTNINTNNNNNNNNNNTYNHYISHNNNNNISNYMYEANLNNNNYNNNNIQYESSSSSSSPSEPSPTYSTSPTTSTVTDFNSPISPILCVDPKLKPNHDADWNVIMSKIKKTMYNSTSVMIPSPATYICENSEYKPKPSRDPQFFYNSGILDVKDIFSYRQLRSESLLYRLFHCPLMKIDADPSSVMRLTKGVFICNQTQPASLPSPQISPLMSSINVFDELLSLNENEQAPIGTFDYGNMKQFMIQQQQLITNNNEGFIPFSYTIGGRYTNPYNGRDVLLRGGQLPMWCQTLFLNECMSRMPLEPNVAYTGLFPFAPSIVITFQTLSSIQNNQNNDSSKNCYPELTLVYEKYAMELSEPDHMMDLDGTTNLWKNQKQQILDKMLYCEIPNESVPILTQLATIWAANQGFLF
ncbi:unnamed protein product [Cunninghamella blakesleeana]